jgi:gluconolactonase
MFDDPARELGFSGVFALSPGGALSVLDDTLAGPNGVALSPDERALYVGNWDPGHKVVVRYGLDDGSRSVLFDMTGAPGEDAIDGLAVDAANGDVYVCGPGGIWVISAGGEHRETIELPEAPHNLAWGDDDGRTLYVTALSSIYRVRRPR